jgi:8-oxo-dGTP pyrophosphatase MutT (NUDIX family)
MALHDDAEALLHAPLPRSLGDGTAAAPRLVVDIWLAVPEREGCRVLLLKRTEAEGGFWQGVSGSVEREDAHLAAAARREIREETGYDEGVVLFDLGRWVEFAGLRSGRAFRKRSLGALLPAHAGPASVRLSDEHDAARLVTFDEARALVMFPVNREELTALEERVRARTGGA